MAEMKPAVKDISINLTNAPRELLLGTKNYELNFTIMNLRSEEKDVSVEFNSDALSVDPPVTDITLAPQEKQIITLNVTPQKDGALDLSVKINLKKIVKYTETVLEGEQGAQSEEIAPKTTPSLVTAEPDEENQVVEVKPSKPEKPMKPVGGAKQAIMKPIKPAGLAKPLKPVGEEKPVIARPTKPAGSVKPMKPVKPVKPVGAAKPLIEEKPSTGDEALEQKIMEIKDQYMTARSQLQSLKQGSKAYVTKYKEATQLKEQYEKLKTIYESGGSVADAGLIPKDPVEELKELMQKYNALKAQLASTKPGKPDYQKIKQEALAVYNEYTEKHEKAKQQGLIS